MIVLLIIVLFGVILYGYLLIDRLDQFIVRDGLVKESKTFEEKKILLYGEQEIIKSIGCMLNDAAITYDFTAELSVKENIIYQWVGAFSEDDTNNLLICLLAKRKNSNVRTMAKCNIIYENVFRQMGVTVIFKNDIPLNRILACLKE